MVTGEESATAISELEDAILNPHDERASVNGTPSVWCTQPFKAIFVVHDDGLGVWRLRPQEGFEKTISTEILLLCSNTKDKNPNSSRLDSLFKKEM